MHKVYRVTVHDNTADSNMRHWMEYNSLMVMYIAAASVAANLQ